MALEYVLIILDIIIIIGLGTCLDSIDGLSYTMYGKGGASLLYEYRRTKRNERKERRNRCKSTKTQEE